MNLTPEQQHNLSKYTEVTILGSKESLIKYKEDFQKFQSNSPSFEESYNNYHNSKYVALNDMIPLVRKCALENNLGLTFSITNHYIQLLILHKTTEVKVIYPPFYIQEKKGVNEKTLEIMLSKVQMLEGMKWSDYYDQIHRVIKLYNQMCTFTAQEIGSAITYYMRYVLVGALFLNKNSYDDDGNTASNLTTGNYSSEEVSNNLPFTTESDAIEWAITKGLNKSQAKDVLTKTPPDDNGKKSEGFYRAVMRLCS